MNTFNEGGYESLDAFAVTQEMHQLEDGAQTNITNIRMGAGAICHLEVDADFLEKGIDANGLLIDQGRTKNQWGRSPGHTPEEFIGDYPEGSIGICPSNFGWGYGGIEIRDGKILSDPNDKTLNGEFSVITSRDGRWSVETFTLVNGLPIEPEKLADIKVGFSMPLLVSQGEVVSPKEYITDIRLLADLRNFSNFAPDTPMPSDFWVLLRKVLPSRPTEAKRLVRGDRLVVHKADMLSDEEFFKLKQYIRDFNLEKYIHLDMRRDTQRFAVMDELPQIRIPVVGVGVTAEGGLFISAVDGRQEKSVGMTLTELAQYMRDRGATHAGLGCAGGDVAVVEKTGAGVKILNVPANKDGEGRQVTRPVPSFLVMEKS
jgi:hypothetical protein